MQLIIAILTALLQFMPIFGTADAQAVGRALAEQAVYDVCELPGGGEKSVVIRIPMDESEYLQLYAPPVLRAFTAAALELQKENIPEDAQNVTFVLMDAAHITGETALHLTGYFLSAIAGGERGIFSGLHAHFRVIDLNVDEDRVPPFFIDLIGRVMNFRLFA